MVELQGVYTPNLKVLWGLVNYTLREINIHRKMSEGKQMFISVTQNWGLYAWKTTFVLIFQKEYEYSVSCPGA